MTSEIKKIRERLPLYVNGRLTESEIAEVEVALKLHPELATELSEFNKIGMAYQSLESEGRAPSNTIYAQILSNIRSNEAKHADISCGRDWIRQLIYFIQKMFASPKIAWGIAAAQLVVIISLLAGGGFDRRYVTLTAPSVPHDQGMSIHIVFVASTPEGTIRELLTRHGAAIIAGPSADRVYILRVDEKRNGEGIIKELRKNPAVVFVEKAY
ncbi:MAG: hypothetical protein A2V65_00425 [Deltaproteobacteria bacterium RBG_13_49_15]|nr:MAG: hypothetical protein A2V65_00425 [Deltaproteobacteria bacterium RBG_13_49_15]